MWLWNLRLEYLLFVQYYSRLFLFIMLCLCFDSPCRPIQDIVEDISEGNMRFAAGGLRELSKLLPDDVEVHCTACRSMQHEIVALFSRVLINWVQIKGGQNRGFVQFNPIVNDPFRGKKKLNNIKYNIKI